MAEVITTSMAKPKGCRQEDVAIKNSILILPCLYNKKIQQLSAQCLMFEICLMKKLDLDHETYLGLCPLLNKIFFFVRKILTWEEMCLQV